MGSNSAKDSTKKEVNFRSDPLWLWGVLAGFAMLIIANGTMIYYATAKDSSQVIGDKPYEMGLRYDEAIAEAKLTRETGWAYEVTECEGMQLCIDLRAKDGSPLNDASVRATLFRPSNPDLDTAGALSPLGEGRYALASLPDKGLWELTLDVSKGTQQARWTRSLYLEP
ncbi:MAG: FixH family protein [Chrysiogenetes bacterium]|nr:FixH family protein [Chrysiogenetes bacterium]